jgi:SAM-dependent methyltransferase
MVLRAASAPSASGPLPRPQGHGGEETSIDADAPRYWEIFFEVHTGLPREAPGDPDSGLRALALMPELPPEPLILDLACGPGAAVPLLAQATGGRVVGLDLHGPFLREMRERAHREGLGSRAVGVQASMEALPFAPGSFDLVWCEGGLYNVGFRRGLEICRAVLRPEGHLAATEAVWLLSEPAEEVRRWWESEYPGITSVQECIRMIEQTGLVLLGHFTLPASAWWGYYRPIEARLADLREKHAGDPLALELLAEHEVEIDMYRRYGHGYGYEFFVCGKSA